MKFSCRRRAFALSLSTLFAVLYWPVGGAAQNGEEIFRQEDVEDVLEETTEPSRTYPYVDFGVLVEIQNDHTYHSDDPGAEINDLFTTIEPVIAIHLLPGLFIEAAGVAEPVFDPAPFEDRYFGDEGLFVEVLSLNYEGEWFGAVGGKFTPDFGTAWDLAPGIYGVDFAEDYELTERIGFGGSITLDGSHIGKHTFSGSTFFLDNTILSESAFTNRGRTHVSDGGPSNTGDLSSFVLALDGAEIPGLDGFAYHAGFAYQDVSQPGEDTEIGYVLGLNWTGEIGDGIEVTPIVEGVYFENADGVWGQDRYYVTAGIGVGYDQWNGAVSYTGRTTSTSGMPDVDDVLLQVSGGYLFDFGLAADAGWAWNREDDVDNFIVGLLLAYEFDLCLGCGE
ncbi:MAG: hypothetical protein GY791_14285 [Alphaproteobacteria bacterium]|nr:hypothetical protein [Alphaproteobacteria bacterium]